MSGSFLGMVLVSLVVEMIIMALAGEREKLRRLFRNLFYVTLVVTAAIVVVSSFTSSRPDSRSEPSGGAGGVAQTSDAGESFVVVYPFEDGLSLRTGPGSSYEQIAVLHAGAELDVAGRPTRGEDDLKWWQVSCPYGKGWVAEWVEGWRLIKPVLRPGDAVEVANPVEDGKVNLRGHDCQVIEVLSLGTRLTVIGGPEHRCDSPGSAIVGEGREWWHVSISDGSQGWIADFESHRQILVAPQWYVELSREVAPP